MRILVESIVLVAAALYFLIGWLTSEQKTANGPILALTSLFVLVLLVFGPKLQAENIARRTVKNGQPVIVRGYEGALGFGEGEHFTAAAFDEFSVKYDETVFALQFSAGQLVLIPRRAVSAETWNWLCTQLVTPEGE